MKRLVVASLVIAVMVAGFPMVGSGDSGMATETDTAGEQSADLPGPSSAVLQLNDTDGSGNETERHRNPDDRDGEGDEGALGSWLSGRLADKLGGGAIQISEGQYELARNVLGDDYDKRLEQFIEVAGDAGNTTAEEKEETLRSARDKEEELIDLRQEFEETRAAYEEAVENGNTERARELARELVALADRIEDVSADLKELLAGVESITGEDLSEVQTTVEQLQNESTAEASEIATRVFESTELSVDIANERLSFLDPAVLTGQIQTVDGEPLADEEIRLTVGNKTHRVETGPDGEFSLEHRPTDLPLSTDTLPVAYVPEPNSIYLGDETNVDVTVMQVEPTLDVQSVPERVSFGETVTVSGDLSVEGIPVDGVPIAVTLGGERLGTIPVSDGSFERAIEIPASVPAGEQELSVSLPFAERALAGVEETQTVVIEETNTSLSVTATQLNGSALQVNGALTTSDGLGVGGQSVDITLDGERIGTVRTQSDGSFATIHPIMPDEGGEKVQVGTTFDGTGSNLRPSQADTIVTLELVAGPNEPGGSGGPGGSGSLVDDTSLLNVVGENALLAGAVLGAGVLGLVLIAARLSRRPDNDGPGGDGTIRDPEPSAERETNVLDSLFDHATTQLESGDAESAIEASYSAVRRQFEATIDTGQALTHWEFYRAYLDAGDKSEETGESDTEDALRDLTETYERAVYSPGTVQVDEAARTVERARRLCARTDGGVTPSEEKA
ncbi:hypothetical protein ACFQJ7_10050 [Halovenus rubra]|uniref:DUF4129 domain-containing protein n=2 Tax=Halovenus rubra TaxID=869890 RepID=A0ABD5X8X3_9EURY|nr:hypothetical protein [Halovenus rubra]